MKPIRHGWCFFFQAEDGIRDFCLSRGLGDVYKRQNVDSENMKFPIKSGDVVGTGTVTVNGENYGNFELLANSDIDLARPSKGSFWNDMKNDIVYVFQYWLSMFR